MPKSVKVEPLGVFELTFFCKIKKMKGGPSETLKKIAKKIVSQRNELHEKMFGHGRDSNPRPSAWQTSKKPN